MAIRRALTLALLLAATVAGAVDGPKDAVVRRIKAAFLYKFASYVEWPVDSFADSASPIVIGVAGAEQLGRELEQAVAGREVASRTLLVRHLKRGEAAGACCHILFVGADTEPKGAHELLAGTMGQPVLTVTEAKGALPEGSVINFLPVDDRVRFDISREAAERNGLQLRSQLLGVARQVSR